MTTFMSKFMDIWEVESHFKCPILGAMLSEQKHRSILEKCGYDVRSLKPYEYHSRIMEKLFGKNTVSVKVNNFIRSKSSKYMKQVRNTDPEALRDLWQSQLKTGNVGPMMYAIISYEDTPVDLLQDVHGEVHMLAHANMTGIIDVRKELVKTRDILEKEKQKNREKQARIKSLVLERKADGKRLVNAEKENAALKTQIRLLENRVDPDISLEQTIGSQAFRIRELEKALEQSLQVVQNKEREHRALEIDMFSLKSENELLQSEMQGLADGLASSVLPPCQGDSNCLKEECSRYQLCAKRIFMIGGMTKMKSYYKDIIEKAGGTFDYHDGYLKNSDTNLEAKVKRSDLILCPVNCNSHNACLRVKKLCSQFNKEFKILNTASLSAVAQAVFVAENQNREIVLS